MPLPRDREVLTILGASVRAATQSARRAGFSVVGADLFGDVDLRRCGESVVVRAYPQGLAAVCAGAQPGGWMYTGALENHPELVGRMAEVRPLLGCGADVLRRVRDPELLAATLGAHGFQIPETVQTARGVPLDGTWLRKPYRSAGGSHISAWTAETAHAGLGARYYLQRRLDGQPCAAVFVAAAGQARLLGVTQQLVGLDWSGAPAFAYAGSLGPLALDAPQTDEFARLGQCLAAEFGLSGLFGVDVIRSQGGLWTIEVNPRYTASIEVLERALDLSAISLHVAACRDGILPETADAADLPLRGPAPAERCVGKVILYARRPTVVSDHLAAILEPSLEAEWPAFADIPQVGTAVASGRPAVTLLAMADSPQEVLQQLRERSAAVEALLDG